MTATLPPVRDEAPPRDVAGDRQTSSGRTLVLVGVFLAIALMVAVPVRSWLAQRSQLDDLRAQIGESQARVSDLQEQRQRWEDPAYVAGQARLRLNMVKPGENGLIALDHTDQRQLEIQQPTADTWYAKLWQHTQATSAGSADPAEQSPDGDQAP